MNKGKESYNNIPLPDSLSASIQKGLDRGKRYTEKKWIAGFGSLAAACLCVTVLLRILPFSGGGSTQTPETPLAARSSDTPAAPQVFSNESPAGNTSGNAAAMPETTMPSSIQVHGTVTEINGSQVTIENDNQDDPYSHIVLNITEDTLILTAQDCTPKKPEDLQLGETLYAYVSPAMTRSLPPMSNAELIICRIPADTAPPTYASITEIISMNEDTPGYVTDRDIIFLIGENTVIKTLDGKKELTAADLKPGTKVLAWYQFMTMSLPAQTTPDEIRVLP